MFFSVRSGCQRCLQVGLGMGASFTLESSHLRSAIIIDYPFCMRSRTTRRVRIHAKSQRRFKDLVSDSVRTDFTQITTIGSPAIHHAVGFEIGPLDPGNHYVNPKKKTPVRKRCGCNTVIFGLYMACTLCQNSNATYT